MVAQQKVELSRLRKATTDLAVLLQDWEWTEEETGDLGPALATVGSLVARLKGLLPASNTLLRSCGCCQEDDDTVV